MTIYQDYSSAYDASTMVSGFLTIILGALVVSSIILVILCIAQWKIFKKAGNPGWYALIPIFNQWKFLEISGLPGWLALIPFANVICMMIAYYKIAIKFGKSSVFSICTVLFPMVCLPIIAFDKSVYGDKTLDSDSISSSTIQSVSQTGFNNVQIVDNDTKVVANDISLSNGSNINDSNNSNI